MTPNLFSIFDPSSSPLHSLNWLSMILFMLFLPTSFWVSPSKYTLIWNLLTNMVYKEMKISLHNLNAPNLITFISIFIFIILNNFISLFPYIFTNTSHLTMTMTFSLTFWISFMIFSWLLNTTHTLIHLTPQGTPYILMPFMVLIETISNLIRPMTLAIRLTANMIAGHLLITLMSQTALSLNTLLIMILITLQCSLMSLEIAVSFIQSYVFSILSMLYSSETN
uniref:ATP synthase subunit a n=1 Tax=Trybliographa sp. ZJUH 20220008 TaxID=2943454 RepID=A0A9E8K2Q7_9HYME|nr:ATP synthase F0 subunit 6 [Trybliographa sp. ZJUH 20220008]